MARNTAESVWVLTERGRSRNGCVRFVWLLTALPSVPPDAREAHNLLLENLWNPVHYHDLHHLLAIRRPRAGTAVCAPMASLAFHIAVPDDLAKTRQYSQRHRAGAAYLRQLFLFVCAATRAFLSQASRAPSPPLLILPFLIVPLHEPLWLQKFVYVVGKE